MINEVNDLLKSHRDWLRGHTLVSQHGKFVEISLPFLNRCNDYVNVYLTKDNDGYVLSDCGETLDELSLVGVEINTPKREHLMNNALAGFGVDYENGLLKLRTTRENFGCNVNNFVQAILAVNDLYYIAKSGVTTNFRSNVVSWLKVKFPQFNERKEIIGKSGSSHSFHFAVRRHDENSTQVFKAISNPTLQAARNLVFSWIDTREKHFPNSSAIAILNDRDQEIPSLVDKTLSQYEIAPVAWSKRNESLELLSI